MMTIETWKHWVMTDRLLLSSMPSNPKYDTITSPRQMRLCSYLHRIPPHLTCPYRISTPSSLSMRQAQLYSFCPASSITVANCSIWKPSLPLRKQEASLSAGILHMLLAMFPCNYTIGTWTLLSGVRISTSTPERVRRAGCSYINATAESTTTI